MMHSGHSSRPVDGAVELLSPQSGATFDLSQRRGFLWRVTKEDKVLTGQVQAANIQAAPEVPMAHPTQELTSENLLDQILNSLTDDKAEEVVKIDLRGKTEVADYMVIASGRSTRQVSAMSEKLADRLKQRFGLVVRSEGKETGDWVLIDTGDVIVHIFRPEVRDFYQLEKMWQPQGS